MADIAKPVSSDALFARAPFNDLRTEHRNALAEALSTKIYAKGEKLIERGDDISACLYVIASGHVQIVCQKKTMVELIEGEAFPMEALSLDHGHPRTDADYQAVDDNTVVWIIERKSIRALQSHSLSFRDFCQHRTTAFGQTRDQNATAHHQDQTGLRRPLSTIAHPAGIAHISVLTDVALLAMTNNCRHIVVIGDNGKVAGLIGPDEVMTAVRNRIDLSEPCSVIMKPVKRALRPTQTAYDAAVEMARDARRTAVVSDVGGGVLGVVEDNDVFNSRLSVTDLAIRIAQATSKEALYGAALRVHEYVAHLATTGMVASKLCALSGMLHDQITQRLIAFVSEHHPDLPPFAWLSLGSEARQERTLASDQDNAIIFEASKGQLSTQRARLMVMAREVNEGLVQCGFALCDGFIMASEASCCLTLPEWQTRFQQWVREPDPQAILNAAIYFDIRPVAGKLHLADPLLDWLTEYAGREKMFLMQMMNGVADWKPPIGLFRDFVVDKNNCINLKAGSATIFAGCARILGLLAGIHPAVPSTVARIEAAQKAGVLSKKDATNSIAAFEFVQGLRIRTQQSRLVNGGTAENLVNPNSLDTLDRKGLLESLRQAASLQKAVAMRLGV